MKRFPADDVDADPNAVPWHPECGDLPTARAYQICVTGTVTFDLDPGRNLQCADNPDFTVALRKALTEVVRFAVAPNDVHVSFVDLTVGTQTAVCVFPIEVTARTAKVCEDLPYLPCDNAMYKTVVNEAVDVTRQAIVASASDAGFNGLAAKVAKRGGDTSGLTGAGTASIDDVPPGDVPPPNGDGTPPGAGAHPHAGVVVTVEIETDDHPGDISWTLTDMCAEGGYATVAQGGNYNGKRETYTTTVPGRASEYLFVILDASGDGLVGNHGPDGHWKVMIDGVEAAKGGDFAVSDSARVGSCERLPPITNKPTNTLTASPTNKPTQPNSVIQVKLMTDNHPDETLWFLVDTCGDDETLEIGGRYKEKGKEYVTDVPVQTPSRFMFAIYDTAGDGLCCNHGPDGYYKVFLNGSLILQGGKFGYSNTMSFGNCVPEETSKPTNSLTASPTAPVLPPYTRTPV